MHVKLPYAALALATAALVAAPTKRATADETPYGGKEFVTQHSGVFNGERIDYTATFGETVLKNDEGAPIASFYSTDYVANNRGKAARPVVFIWNGGPIAASQTLHMAGFGPKRLVVPTDVDTPIEPPFTVKDNKRTLLDIADLVFVDPAETGFSRILPAGSREYFYSTQGDAASIAQFIERWLEDRDRADSPAFVMGTSYGSIRAAAVAGALAETEASLEGVILLSQGVNLVETTQRANSLIGYASNIPQLAAIAWFHNRGSHLNKSVFEVLDESYDFAMSDYLVAIAKGANISDAELRAVATRLSGFIGVRIDDLIENMLLIKKPQFRQELLRNEGLALAAGDARYAYPADGESPGNPPTQGVADVHRRHLRDFLGVTFPIEEYRGFAPDIDGWDYGGSSTLHGRKEPIGAARSVFADFNWSEDLEKAFHANDAFRLFIATGVYDTLTTAGPARLLAADVDFPQTRVTLGEYEGGHAFYSNDAEFGRLSEDIREFIKND